MRTSTAQICGYQMVSHAYSTWAANSSDTDSLMQIYYQRKAATAAARALALLLQHLEEYRA